jgi:hypothetical protein
MRWAATPANGPQAYCRAAKGPMASREKRTCLPTTRFPASRLAGRASNRFSGCSGTPHPAATRSKTSRSQRPGRVRWIGLIDRAADMHVDHVLPSSPRENRSADPLRQQLVEVVGLGGDELAHREIVDDQQGDVGELADAGGLGLLQVEWAQRRSARSLVQRHPLQCSAANWHWAQCGGWRCRPGQRVPAAISFWRSSTTPEPHRPRGACGGSASIRRPNTLDIAFRSHLHVPVRALHPICRFLILIRLSATRNP